VRLSVELDEEATEEQRRAAASELKRWSVKGRVLPIYRFKSVKELSDAAPPSLGAIAELERRLSGWSRHEDQALLKWMVDIGQKKQHAGLAVLDMAFAEAVPTEQEGGVERMLAGVATLKRRTAQDLEERWMILREVNQLARESFNLIDLSGSDAATFESSAAGQLSQSKHVLLPAVCNSHWDSFISQTPGTGSQFELRLSRARAIALARSGQTDTEGRRTVFAQAFRALHPMAPRLLRRSDQLYNTIFLGERAQDAGGPYRETFETYCAELESPLLPLFIPCTNQTNNAGVNGDKWVPNPQALQPLHLSMYRFVGKLMGIALRSGLMLPLSWPSLVWKFFSRERRTRADLFGIDKFLAQSLERIRTFDKTPGCSEDMFEDLFPLFFTVQTADGRTVELEAGGATRPVRFADRERYVRMVEAYKLSEFDRQLTAIFEGF
jgi:hypothetical protein